MTTVGELLIKYVNLQHREERSHAYNVQKVIEKHLVPILGKVDASDPNLFSMMEDYIDRRKLEKRGNKFTSNSTINNEVSYVRSALKLLRPEPRILAIPKLDTRKNVRQGVVSREDYQALLEVLEPYQKPVWCLSYFTGVRQGQILKLRREWGVSALETGFLSVPGWDCGKRMTKNALPHLIPLYMPEMRAHVEAAVEQGNARCPFLFQREGRAIVKQTFWASYKRAGLQVKLEGLLFHDLRRTAVTNMIEAGIRPEDAMLISGHKDPKVFQRYNILDLHKAKTKAEKTSQTMSQWHLSTGPR